MQLQRSQELWVILADMSQHLVVALPAEVHPADRALTSTTFDRTPMFLRLGNAFVAHITKPAAGRPTKDSLLP